MKVEIKVPAMGESITEATVGTILKSSGSVVNADDEILELETDKVNQVLYAPQSGVVTYSIEPGQVVKIGQVIGTVETDGAGKTQAAPAKEAPSKKKANGKESAAAAPPPSLEPPATGKTSANGARKTKEAFLEDVQQKESSEPLPVIKPKAAASQTSASQTPAPLVRQQTTLEGRETRRKMTRIRRVIADKLVEAQRTTAMLTTFNEVDMSQIIALRERYKETFAKRHGTKLGFMSFFIKASVAALEAFPDVNSYIDGDEIVHREYYDIGIAVGTDRGLFVPVVHNCDKLTFAEIESQIESFALKARDGTISVDDLQGGGFTITNGGIYGSLLSTPILNPPQSAILGMHKIMKRPVAVNDQVVIKPMMYLALSYDHRIVDGKEAVSFLVRIKDLLEEPAGLLLNI